MNDTLKAAGHIGAELGAAKAENEMLRELLRDVEFRGALTGWEPGLIGQITAALAQQAEPTDTFTATDMTTAAAQGFRDGQAAVEPAPAQDEQYPPCDFCGVIPDHHPWHGSGLFKGVDSPHLHACNECRPLLPARPAQIEQQPVAWMLEGAVGGSCLEFQQSDLLDSQRRYGGCMVPLFVAPIAQAAPQGKFRMGDLVKKSTGSEWEGRVVGWYSTEQTPEGYAVESSAHRNSVQIYPAKALEAV